MIILQERFANDLETFQQELTTEEWDYLLQQKQFTDSFHESSIHFTKALAHELLNDRVQLKFDFV